MKAEELRIGNYVRIDEGIGRVTFIMDKNFCNEYANDDYNITVEMGDGIFREEEEDKVEGIPLTEEILLNCGFEKINHVHGYSFYSFNRKSLKDMNVYMPLYIYLNPNYAKIADFTIKQNVEYVHQLQNLFFAINGKELNINL